MFDWLIIFQSSTVIGVFILELAERTAYYGTVFAIPEFSTLMLRLQTGDTFIITNAVFALSPLSAFVAGILADTWFHRTEILIAAASVYVFAFGLIALSANPAFFGTDQDFAQPTLAPFLLFFPGLALLSVGYGAFKVCTSLLVAEGVLSVARKSVTFAVSGFEEVDTQRILADENCCSKSYDMNGKGRIFVDHEDDCINRNLSVDQEAVNSSSDDSREDASVDHQDSSSSSFAATAKKQSSALTFKSDHHSSFVEEGGEEPSLLQQQDSSTASDKKKITFDKDALLALTYTVYTGVINLGSVIGFSVIPSLRNLGSIEYYTGTLADDGKKKSAGYIYAWGACFGFAALALVIFILLAKFSKNFVRPKQMFRSSPESKSKNPNDTKQISVVEDDGEEINHDDEEDDDDQQQHHHHNRINQHPVQYLAELAEAVGLSCLVGCCCPASSSSTLDGENEDHDDNLQQTTNNNKKSERHVRSLTNVLKIFSMLPIYWAATSSTASSFQVQAFCAYLPPWLSVDMLNTANTVAFLASLPLIQVLTSKLLERLHRNGSLCFGLFKSVLVLRLFLGMVISALAMICAGFLQIEIDAVATLTEQGDCILKDQSASPSQVLPGAAKISLPFIVSGIAQAFNDPAALEAAFELAPPDMRSTVMSIYLLESSLSGFIGLGIAPVFANPKQYTLNFFSISSVLCVLSFVWALWVKNVHKQTAPSAVVEAAAKHKESSTKAEDPSQPLLPEA